MKILPPPNPHSKKLLDLDKIFIWIESLAPPFRLALLTSYLSHAEKERAARYKTVDLQTRFIAARGRLREILGIHLNIPPCQIEFIYNPFGKPFLHAKHLSPIHFNLSHSHDRLAIALAMNSQIGIDIEQHSKDNDLSKIIFSKQESEHYNKLPEHAKKDRLFQAWTLKEAYVKALGSGLNTNIRNVEVLQQSHCDSFSLDQWTLCALPMGAGWAGALVTNAQNVMLIFCNK
ncbi:MAG: 4'-phosphopantetheinyl transferase [Parachlamydiales bacterium]|nr:4'-phosphopantetheinyl transferase [Parachlamydiales bacterium]